MRKKTALASTIALSVTVLLSASALADSPGAAGKVVSITINGSKSDDYKSFHGSLEILPPGKNTRPLDYKWGGTKCPGKDLTDHEVDILVDAFYHRKTTQVVPHSKNGQANTRCLVGFELQRRSSSTPTPS